MDDEAWQRAIDANADFVVVRPGEPVVAKAGRRGRTVRYPVQIVRAIVQAHEIETLVHLGDPLLEPGRIYLVATIATARFPDARQMLVFEPVDPGALDRTCDELRERLSRHRPMAKRGSES